MSTATITTDLYALPDRLPSPLPERWQDCYQPVDIPVACGDETHTVRWTPDKVTLCDHHHDAETALEALGGEPSGCARFVADAGTWAEKRPGVRARFDETVGRTHLVAVAFADWAARHGAPVGDLGRFQVTYGLAGKASVTDPGSDTVPLIGLYAAWDATTPARGVIMVPDTWYDTVRALGWDIDGRFVCGEGLDGLVVSSHDTDPVGGITTVVATLEHGPRYTATPTTAVADDPTASVVCGFANWEYDDNVYWCGDGSTPSHIAPTRNAAIIWSRTYDVIETFATGSEMWMFVEAMGNPEFPDGYNPEEDSNATLMRRIVARAADPALYTPDFTTASVVPIRA